MRSKREIAIGVDIGGTNLKLGVVMTDGNLLEQRSFPIVRDISDRADIHYISSKIAELVNKYAKSDNILGIGVSCPGILDTNNAKIKYAVNLNWDNISLDQIVPQHWGFPAYLEYDALAGAMGEKQYGAAQPFDDFIYVCIGTGMGASLFVNGSPFKSGMISSVNLGHMSIDYDGISCKCGNKGCVENYVSAPAITYRIRNDLPMMETILHDYIRSEPNADLLALVYKAAVAGDPYALEVFRDAGRWLGISLVNCMQMFGVTNIVVGGGVSQAGALLLNSTREEINLRIRDHIGTLQLIQAKFPTSSGIMGAAASVFSNVKITQY